MKDVGSTASATSVSHVLRYNSVQFVNRKDEIALVVEKAKAISLGQKVRERTIVFWGLRGTGKTWLLRRIKEVLEEMPGIKPLYCDFNLYAHQSVEEVVRNLMAWTVEDIWGLNSEQTLLYRRASDVSFATTRDWLMDDIQALLQEQVLVLLLDHVFESDWDLLAGIENSFLAYLNIQSRVLIVMVGRGQTYPWKTPEFRLYVQDYHLQPFTQDFTQAQLQKQKPEAVRRTSEIHELSQGYPLANYLLAARPTVTQAMKETVDGLLEGVEAEERAWLEALCILRTFDEDCIPAILAAYFQDESIARWSYQEIRRVRDRLLRTRMVRWREETGGWVVDEAIRPVLEKYLQDTQSEVWQRLHCAAYRLYQSWKRRYPEKGFHWQAEISYHTQCLRDAGHTLQDCP